MADQGKTKTRRGYGTGSLKRVGSSWIGSWYAPSGAKIKCKVGVVRTAGERDGLTIAQAEARFRRMRGAERPRAAAERVTMLEAGDELSRRLEIRGRKKSHRLTVAADLSNHIAPFFAGKELGDNWEQVRTILEAKARTPSCPGARECPQSSTGSFPPRPGNDRVETEMKVYIWTDGAAMPNGPLAS